MIYFIVGIAMGGIMLAQPVMGWSQRLQALRPVYLHFLFIGWVTQMIMGVGYWMFPKYSKEKPRGSEKLGWAVFVLLNTGLILRAIGEPAMMLTPQAEYGWTWKLLNPHIELMVFGWTMQLVMGVAFFVYFLLSLTGECDVDIVRK